VPFSYSIATPTIKFYTAKIVEKASNSHDSVADQESYHRALRFTYSDKSVEIIEGYYSVVQASAYLVDPKFPGKWPRECERADVWKLEEKQSDVNLAVDSVSDVLKDADIGHVVFVTNDTDIAPALRKLKELTKVKIGLVIPTRHLERKENRELSKYADWVRSSITNDELRKSLLPRTISGGKKSANRPISWFGQPELVEEILDVLKPVIPSPAKRWKWLDEEKPNPAGLPVLKDVPSNLLDDEVTAQHVLLHAKAYVEYMLSLVR
jgi:6-hydroxy-3-succinoylpyridine 3-monooxygenase